MVTANLTYSDGTLPYTLNRFAFELNNPVNNVDLTGHNIRDVLIGIRIGLVLVGIAAAIIVSGGAAAPWGAVAAGALLGGGLNAITYSATHTNQDAATFTKASPPMSPLGR